MNNYILQTTINKLNNYELLVLTTENFTQFMYFLQTYRNCKNKELKIGEFKYDDWTGYLYCILNEQEGVYFEHRRDIDNKTWKHKTLTEQLIYAWGFNEIKFEINFNIINEFWNLLDKKSQEQYDELYDEVHCKFW